MEYAVLWILLMFTPPGEQGGGKVVVIDHYTKKERCVEDETRALEIGLPEGSQVTCVPMKRPNII